MRLRVILAFEPGVLNPENFHITDDSGESLAIARQTEEGYRISDDTVQFADP